MIYLYRAGESLIRKELHAMEKKSSWALLRKAIDIHYPKGEKLPLTEILETGLHGKPYVKGNPFFFNLSHSGGIVVCGVAECEIGVDIEKKRRFSDRLKRRICTEAELALVEAEMNEDDALTHLWTMKESYMKYTGLGLAQGILSTEFSEISETPKLRADTSAFFSVDIGTAWLTVCTEYHVPCEISWVSHEEIKGYII